MNNDLISRESLRNVILNDRKLDGASANWEVNRILVHIDKAPTVEPSLTPEQENIIEELENICINNEYVLDLLAKLKNEKTPS